MSLLTLLRNRTLRPVGRNNFDSFPRIDSGPWFSHFTSAYDNERKLYDLFLTEAFNLHGVCCDYFEISVDTSYDKVFGEDMNQMIVRNFEIMAKFDLPRETKSFSTQGQLWLDKFHIYISKKHFASASSEYLPKIGDIIRSQYNDVYYEVLSVKAEEEQFLQAKHSWDLTVRVYVDKHQNVNPATSADMGSLPSYVDNTDLFNIGTWINNEKGNALYTPDPTECSVKDPFNDWTDN